MTMTGIDSNSHGVHSCMTEIKFRVAEVERLLPAEQAKVQSVLSTEIKGRL